MSEYAIDRRNLEFMLYEQFQVDKLGEKLSRYKELDRDICDAVLTSAIDLYREQAAPLRALSDAEGCKLVDGQVYVPEAYKDLYRQYAEAGLIAPARDVEFGGMGLPLSIALVLQGLGIMADPSFMFYPGLTVAAGHVLENFAEPELRDLLVPKMYQGEWTGTMCLTEPQAGTAVGDIRTTATPIEGSKGYKIVGNKIFISAGDHQLTENIIHLVLARIPGDPKGVKGISLFAVPKYRFDKDGNITGSNDVTTAAIEHKMGIHGSSTCALSFGENNDCIGYMLGERCKGIVAMFQMMNEARIACGMQGAAMASSAYLMALAYAKERVQGSKITDRSPDAPSVTIIEHPDVRRNLLISKAYSEGLMALLLQSAIYAEYAEFSEDPAEKEKNSDLLNLMTPICKAYATDKGFKVAELAIQIHGGYGYIKEYGVEQIMRDVKIASIYEGTNGIQALDLLGRKMRQKGGQLFMTWVQETTNFLEKHASHPRLGEQAKAIDKAKNALGEVAFGFTVKGKQDPELAMLGATPFLEMFGHVEVARLLLDQAVIADEALQKLYEANGATSPEQQRALCQENDEARFYDGKIKSANYFVSGILPQAFAIAKEIKSDDRSALDIVF